MAERAGYQDIDRLGRVCHRLENGAETGCRGRGRLSTKHRNADSAYEYGDRISDALQDWVVQGICAGPLRKEEIPWKDITVSPIGGRLKPNGKIRVIIDASAPHDSNEGTPGWLLNPDKPGSVNSTIMTEEFPAKMSSVNKFVRALWRVGR